MSKDWRYDYTEWRNIANGLRGKLDWAIKERDEARALAEEHRNWRRFDYYGSTKEYEECTEISGDDWDLPWEEDDNGKG